MTMFSKNLWWAMAPLTPLATPMCRHRGLAQQ